MKCARFHKQLSWVLTHGHPAPSSFSIGRGWLAMRQIPVPSDDSSCTPPSFPTEKNTKEKHIIWVNYWKSCSRSFPFPLYGLSFCPCYFWPGPLQFYQISFGKYLWTSTSTCACNTAMSRFKSYFQRKEGIIYQAVVDAIIGLYFSKCAIEGKKRVSNGELRLKVWKGYHWSWNL